MREGETMKETKKAGLHYVLVIMTGMVLCMAPGAIPTSCAGIFFPPLGEYLSASKGELGLYLTILALSMTAVLPFAGRLMGRMDIRVVLTAGVLLSGLPLMAMSFFTMIWQWYVASVFLGAGVAVSLFLAVPTLVNRWFAKKTGFYIGLCMAFSGVGGIVFNALGGVLIAGGPEGWRMGYLVLGVITLAIALPFTLFAVRSNPSDRGIAPFGADEIGAGEAKGVVDAGGVTAKRAMRLPVFFAILAFYGLANFIAVFLNFLPTYAVSLEDVAPAVATAGATVASAVALGQAVAKIGIGWINDKSTAMGLSIGIVSTIGGILVLWFVPTEVVTIHLGAVFFGAVAALVTVLGPILSRRAFGMREYSAIYSRITMAGGLTAAVGTTLWGIIIDVGGFSAVFIFMIALMAVIALLGVYALKAGPGVLARESESA